MERGLARQYNLFWVHQDKRRGMAMIELLLHEKNTECKIIHDIQSVKGYIGRKGTLMWLDIEKPTAEDMRSLEQEFSFHPLAIEDCMTDIQRPKIDHYEGYLFIVLHAASLAAHKDKATSLEVDIFIGANYIITVHMKPIKSIISSRERCVKNPQIMSNGPARLLYNITDALVDNYFPILEKLDTEIEGLEQRMFKSHSSENITKILSLTETVLTLRRFVGPQREIVNFLVRGDYEPIISTDLSIYFRDIKDLLARISDTLDSYRDALTSILGGYTSVASNRLNEIMKVLTVIATIMMPLTLVSGIYGMNFRYMPELQWKYGYIAILLFMFTLGFGMLIYFKHKKWL